MDPHVGDIHGRGAVLIVVHGLKDLSGGLEPAKLLRLLLGGQAEDKAVLKGLQREPFEIARVGHHIAVEVVGKAIQSIQVDPGADPVFQDPRLVLHTVGGEEGPGVLDVHRLLLDGQGLGGQLAHPLLHLGQQGGIQGKVTPCPAEQGIAQGELHPDVLHLVPAHRVVKGLQHQQDGAALIGLAAGLVRGGHHSQRAVPLDGLIQLPQLAVPVHQQDVVGMIPLHLVGHRLIGRARGVQALFSVYGHAKHVFVLHAVLL